MLVCNISLHARRIAIDADVAETAAALDSPGTGNVVFATLVDDPASVAEFVDAYLGEIMLEAASAADSLDGSLAANYTVDLAEIATAADVCFTVSSWTPANLTGLIGWWDVSVTSSLTLSGSNITAIADQSGGGHTMAQEGGTGTPTYNPTGFNSTKPAMLFGPPSNLRAASFPMGTGNTLTFWVVTQMMAGGVNYARYLSYAVSGADYNQVGAWAFNRNALSTTSNRFSRNSINADTSTITASPAPHRFIGTIDATGNITIYSDGVSVATATSGGNWSNGGNMRIGSDAGAGSYMDGPVAECGVATGYSDATTVAQLDTYLKTKWGL